MQNRKLLLRELTNYSQQREVIKLLYSKRKASIVLIIFIEQFWKYFFEQLWKFYCEIMAE